MSFVEVQFPTEIAYGSAGGPAYATEVVQSASGREQRNVLWASARLRYNVAHGVKTEAQMAELIAFFRARKGRAYGFRFKDWSDYVATNQLLAVADGTQTTFNLIKLYSNGGVIETRRIHKPVSGSVVVRVDGVVQTSGVSIDTTTGVITFTTAPTSGQEVRADFEFDVPVRFDTDHLNAELSDFGVHSWRDIPLIEIRL